MKAGLTYVLRIGIKGPLRENWHVALTLTEQDSDGHMLRKIAPHQSC